MGQYAKGLTDFNRLQQSRLERMEGFEHGSRTAKAQCRPTPCRMDTTDCRLQKQRDEREELVPGKRRIRENVLLLAKANLQACPGAASARVCRTAWSAFSLFCCGIIGDCRSQRSGICRCRCTDIARAASRALITMLNDFTAAERVYIACGYTDIRKGIDGLSI